MKKEIKRWVKFLDPSSFAVDEWTRDIYIVEPYADYPFEFEGLCIGVRHGFLQVRDMDDNVHELEIAQFTPNKQQPSVRRSVTT